MTRKTKSTPAKPPFWQSPKAAWCGLLLVIVLFGAIRIKMLDMPLERDEGEYAYAGQLMLQGIPPYKMAYNMKLPGTYMAYAAIMAVFGQTVAGIHLGLLVLNSLATVLVFLLARKWFDAWSGVTAAAAFALFSASPNLLGLAAHANHFVTFFVLLGIWWTIKAFERPSAIRIAGAGTCMGLAFLMKQHGAYFCLFALLWFGMREWKQHPREWRQSARRLGWFVLGMAAPLALTCLWLWMAGVFDKFWFWTFRYAREYVQAHPASGAWRNFNVQSDDVFMPALGIWCFSGLGLLLLWQEAVRREAAFLLAFFLFSAAAVSAGFYFREQYFLLLLPANALLAGAAFRAGADLLGRFLKTPGPSVVMGAVFLAAFGLTCKNHLVVWRQDPKTACEMIYMGNPFTAAVEVGEILKKHTAPDARVAVMGSEPQIYFYSRRRSATGHIYTYGLMEEHPYAKTMQEEMIREIEAAAPAFLVFVDIGYSWLIRSNSEKMIFAWAESYAKQHYDMVGGMELTIDGEKPAEERGLGDSHGIYIYQRR